MFVKLQTVNAGTEVITQLKSNGENGNGEAIPPIDVVTESNGDCQAAVDVTAETIPANGSIAEIKVRFSSFIRILLSMLNLVNAFSIYGRRSRIPLTGFIRKSLSKRPKLRSLHLLRKNQ